MAVKRNSKMELIKVEYNSSGAATKDMAGFKVYNLLNLSELCAAYKISKM